MLYRRTNISREGKLSLREQGATFMSVATGAQHHVSHQFSNLFSRLAIHLHNTNVSVLQFVNSQACCILTAII